MVFQRKHHSPQEYQYKILIHEKYAPLFTYFKYSVTQLYLTLCDPTDCSPPDSSVHGIFLARVLEWVAFPPLGDLPDGGIKPTSPASPELAGRFFTTELPGNHSTVTGYEITRW